MSRVEEILAAEREKLRAELEQLQVERDRQQAVVDELDQRILGKQTALDNMDADLSALPERLKPQMVAEQAKVVRRA
jgi:hypothetical protein